MYERFTDRARKVMQLANQEAQRFNHEYIGTEHILLGLVSEGSGVAANVLKNLSIELRKVRREIEKIVQHGPGGERPPKGRLPQTPRAQKVIDYSIDEARRLGHNYVGTEHLLLGLLREEEGVASLVLMNLGLKLEEVRKEVLSLLGQNLLKAAKPPTEALLVSEPEPVPTAETLIEKHLRRFRVQLRQAEEQKDAAVSAQDFEQAARWRDITCAFKHLMNLYEALRKAN